MNRQEKLNFILKHAGKCKLINECEEAIIGYIELPNNSFRAAYNKKEVINLLVRTKNLTEVEAIEYYYEKYLNLKESPIFIEGFYDQQISDLILEENEDQFMRDLIENGNWELFMCDAESSDYEYLLILNGNKIKESNINLEYNSGNIAQLFQFSNELNLSASA